MASLQSPAEVSASQPPAGGTPAASDDAAPSALEQAVVDCDPALTNLAVEPRFEPIRSDSRYTRLLNLLGLA